MRKALTDRSVETAASTNSPQTDYFDALCPGLSIRVTTAGKRTWAFTYTSPKDGKRARITLGTYPATSLKQAREKAVEARSQVERGADPRDVTPPPAVEKTLADLVPQRLREMETEGRRSVTAVERRLQKNVVPIVGNVFLKDFHIRHLNMIIDPIKERGSLIESNRVFEDVKALLNFAVRRGDIDYSPLDKAKKSVLPVRRVRWLTCDEIAIIWRMLPDTLAKSTHVPTILRLCLVTGQRLSEVAGMTRGEIDAAKRLWTIPGARVKNKYDQVVPLSDLAMEIIGECLRKTNGQWLFPNNAAEGPLLANAIDRAIARAQEPTADAPLGKFGVPKWRPHDLRRTVATQMSRRENGLVIPHLVISHVLNHRSVTKVSITQGVYDQNDFLDEKREALDKWGAFLSRLVAGDKVVAIEQARAA